MTAQDIIDTVDKRIADFNSDDPVLKRNAKEQDVCSIHFSRDVQLVVYAFHQGRAEATGTVGLKRFK